MPKERPARSRKAYHILRIWVLRALREEKKWGRLKDVYGVAPGFYRECNGKTASIHISGSSGQGKLLTSPAALRGRPRSLNLRGMRSKTEVMAALCTPGVIAVVRARSAEQVIPLAEALLKGGIIAIEITMTTPNAIDAISRASKELGENALVGVGTVLNAETAHEAIDAGAEFVVSPVMRPEIVHAAREHGRPVMLGAYTPTEAQAAHEAGSDFVKLFPAEGLGVGYIKALRAPLPHLKIVPTGGVTAENVAEFLNAGCAAVGAGSSLIPARVLDSNDWTELEMIARRFSENAACARRPV